MKIALQKNVKLERKLKKLEQRIEELKDKDSIAQIAFKNERKQLKDEKKVLSQDNHSLKGEVGSLKKKVLEHSSEKELNQKKLEKQMNALKAKDEEIAKLHALMLKERTEHEKILAFRELTIVGTPTARSDGMTFADLLAAEGEIAATFEAAPAKQIELDKKHDDLTEELLNEGI